MIGNLHPNQLRWLNGRPCVQEVEDEAMDEGRFFVHLEPGYDWCYDPRQVTRTKSFNSFKDARWWIEHRVAHVAVGEPT